MADTTLIQASGPAILDLSSYAGQNVNLDFSVRRSSDYNNIAGFYRVADRAGSVNHGSSFYTPGNPAYLNAALTDSNLLKSQGQPVALSAKNNKTSSSSFEVSGGGLWAPYASNGKGNTYVSWSSANPGSFNNLRTEGVNKFSLEDLPGGGDRDRNDLIVTVAAGSSSGGGGGGGGGGSTLPPSYFSISDGKALEGQSAAITITRTGNLSTTQQLQLTSIGGTAQLGLDYDKVDQQITFAPNQASYVSLIPTKSDTRAEPTEFITLQLQPGSQQGENPTPQLTRQIGYVSILDADDDWAMNGFGNTSQAPIAISGGVQATGNSTVNIPGMPSVLSPALSSLSALSPAVVVGAPYLYSNYWGPNYWPGYATFPSSQTIAISGGIEASENSQINIGRDPIALGVNQGTAFVASSPIFSAATSTAVDMLHFTHGLPLFSLGVGPTFPHLGGWATGGASVLVISPEQAAILTSGAPKAV